MAIFFMEAYGWPLCGSKVGNGARGGPPEGAMGGCNGGRAREATGLRRFEKAKIAL